MNLFLKYISQSVTIYTFATVYLEYGMYYLTINYFKHKCLTLWNHKPHFTITNLLFRDMFYWIQFAEQMHSFSIDTHFQAIGVSALHGIFKPPSERLYSICARAYMAKRKTDCRTESTYVTQIYRAKRCWISF